jgi:hypothetical protein
VELAEQIVATTLEQNENGAYDSVDVKAGVQAAIQTLHVLHLAWKKLLSFHCDIAPMIRHSPGSKEKKMRRALGVLVLLVLAIAVLLFVNTFAFSQSYAEMNVGATGNAGYSGPQVNGRIGVYAPYESVFFNGYTGLGYVNKYKAGAGLEAEAVGAVGFRFQLNHEAEFNKQILMSVGPALRFSDLKIVGEYGKHAFYPGVNVNLEVPQWNLYFATYGFLAGTDKQNKSKQAYMDVSWFIKPPPTNHWSLHGQFGVFSYFPTYEFNRGRNLAQWIEIGPRYSW